MESQVHVKRHTHMHLQLQLHLHIVSIRCL